MLYIFQNRYKEGLKIIDKKSKKDPDFLNLEEDLKKVLLSLKQNKFIQINYSSGVKLNLNILNNKELFHQAINFINHNYESLEQRFCLVIIRLLKFSKSLLGFAKISDIYEFEKFRSSNGNDSKPKFPVEKQKSDKGEIIDKFGGSKPDRSNLGVSGRGVEFHENINDIPNYNFPELQRERLEYYGIWISQVALRHFQSLKVRLDASGSIFQKIETHFNPSYNTKNNYTAISKDEKKNLGICFSFHFTKYGYLRLHVSMPKEERDIERFVKDFFNIFKLKVGLTDEEIIELMESLYLERKNELAFKIHEARGIGPKKTIDEKFKGAKIKVTEVHWFGQPEYKAGIDYSDLMKPHIEAEGPADQVCRFMGLTAGIPEMVSNLTDIREVGYRTRNEVNVNTQGIGQLSRMVMPKEDVLAEFSEIDAKMGIYDLNQEIRHVETKQLFKEAIKGILNNSNNLGQTLLTLDESLKEVKDELKQDLLEFEGDVVTGLNLINSNVDNTRKKMVSIVDNTKNDVNSNVDNTRNHLSNKIDGLEKNIVSRFDSQDKFLAAEFKNIRFRIKNSLYLILRKLEKVPGMTAKKLHSELKVSKKTLYNYLKILQDKKLIVPVKKISNSRGRPPNVFRLNFKTIYKKIKGADK